ncbi:MAG: hypothetical protein AAF985_05580 [Bacteroidota bacterium]
MLQTRLWESLHCPSARQLNGFGKFLQSPYFNQRRDLVDLYQSLKRAIDREKALSRVELWQSTFPEKEYVEQDLRLLMTYLQRLLEQFIAVEQTLEDKVGIKLQTAAWYRSKGMDKLHKTALNKGVLYLEKAPLRNAEYFYQQFQFELEKYKIASHTKPDATVDFQKVIEQLDIAFLSMKLRQSCELMIHDRIYNWGFDSGFIDQIFTYLEEQKLIAIPAIGIYYYCYRMLETPEEEKWFQSFKKELLERGQYFDQEEIHNLYILAINYCVRRANDGFRHYFVDIMDFYRKGLDREYLLQNGVLSRFTYHNIVSAALKIDQSDWAESFIGEWMPRLEKRYRERMFSFNRAKIAYHRKDYDAAIPLLQRANYHDLLLNLGARTLLLKIYHELNEFELLQSHLDAFSSYLRRKSGLGYHRKNYRNLIHFTNRLLSLNLTDRHAIEQFKGEVLKTEILTEREWLLARLN